MTISIEELWSMAEPALIGAYQSARRQFVEEVRARHAAGAAGLDAGQAVPHQRRRGQRAQDGAVDVSEELARKGQQLREMTRDLDLVKVDVDIIAVVIRLRGVSAAGGHAEDGGDDAEPDNG
jgi:hypothetical protein